ncbi:transcriptional repressor CTCFL-like [Copidosoma floridanum]|uniref:transcriptional repressor CTCFL-like n=1 Tax=Copidosoma floridanum TaxID=29053 RepID=UPI000C6F935D|nr:transcriptional repressor CTCFL-like [Copidosoma floridanum]
MLHRNTKLLRSMWQKSKKSSRRDRYNFNSATGKYHCPKCNNAYGRHDTMMSHLRHECEKLPRFKCPYCPQVSKKTSNIYQHIRSVHQNCPVTVVKLY